MTGSLLADVRLVTAGDWSVSTEHAPSLFDGYKLKARVFDPQTFERIESLPSDGVIFPTQDEARFAALDGGALKVYIPRWRMEAADLAACTH